MERKVKYSYEFKLRCVREVLNHHQTVETVSELNGCHHTTLHDWIRFYEKYGKKSLLPRKNQVYSLQFKLKVLESINQDLLSLSQACLKFNIPTKSVIINWQRNYKKSGIIGLNNKPRGNPKSMEFKRRKKKSNKPLTREEELLLENESLRAELDLLKKVSGLNSRRAKQKAQAITELRHKYDLELLLNHSNMARSSYYYHQKRSHLIDKYKEIKQLINQIYHHHKGRYGYRRITLEINKTGFIINHKTVLRLMSELGLKSLVRIKKYKSYKGQRGEIAPNILQRNFKAVKPNKKWATDITEFKVFGNKLYLSPIIDLFNGEIISYELSEKPNFKQVVTMLKKSFNKISNHTNLILHSDQGWQYQRLLKGKGITQSMSRKGNCLDNAVIENFFGTLKSELFYLNKYKSIAQLKQDIKKYINYYNKERIKLNLKGMSPIEYRAHYYQN